MGGAHPASARINTSSVMGLRAAIAPRGVLSDFIAVRTFYSGGCGSVAIDTTDLTQRGSQPLG